ncbi:helix-turn-helix transcriptional regulator [Paenibacillus dokdonensis]|uniref:Helix-turn-helix transcriptional regulator n=1 Tax=Paenibacillus dokdonensis TaxID=2567944 RepID=A0ABU6GSS0_9BACL|nr:helix-turn-helix transcriptional regulator [Paenibacillus dokdonensis]MEC0241222.1 helix-turn-helix transcriptional regulator [Paenibacillus dokdonensis]
MGDDSKRRKELGSFLKTCRLRLSPAEFGIQSSPHRRTNGLRREEVADLAGLSTIWYTWLEQGRDIRPSSQVLESLGKALRLNRHELLHLYTLAEHRPPYDFQADTQVEPSLQRMLDKLEPFPSIITGPRWDVLAWNQAACELVDFNRMNTLERNSLWRMFVRPDYPDSLPEWPKVAKGLLAQFRTSYGRHIGDPRFEELVELLKKESDTFKDWWENHEVLSTPPGTKRIRHPVKGELEFHQQSMTLANHPDLKVTVYIPCIPLLDVQMSQV